MTPPRSRFIRAHLAEETEEAREWRHAGDDYSEVVLDHGPHDEIGAVDVVGERFDGANAHDLDGGYEDAEGEEAEEDEFFAGRDLGLDEEGEGGEHAGKRVRGREVKWREIKGQGETNMMTSKRMVMDAMLV